MSRPTPKGFATPPQSTSRAFADLLASAVHEPGIPEPSARRVLRIADLILRAGTDEGVRS